MNPELYVLEWFDMTFRPYFTAFYKIIRTLGELQAYPVSNLIHKRNAVKDIPEAQQRLAV
jgi:hypothetical protein